MAGNDGSLSPNPWDDLISIYFNQLSPFCPFSGVFASPPTLPFSWLRSPLEVPQDGDLQTLRVYARDLPWGAADGGRHLPQDLSEMPLG